MPVQRPCLDCGQLTTATRCAVCEQAHKRRSYRRQDAQRPNATARGYGTAWRREARERIAEYRRLHGDICPGFNTYPHPATDWVCDHDLGPMCRSCNSRKAATFDKYGRFTHS